MEILKDKNWAWRTKNSVNVRIETDDGIFDAFVYPGGGASVYIDEETVINYGRGEFEPLELLSRK